MAYASVIGSSAVIRGNVRGDTSLEILGRVEGDVGVTGDLALGPGAVVVGAVSGARVIIGGSVEGDVTGTEAVLVAETGRVIGDLAAPRIGMSEGAHVRGGVRTEGGAGGTSRPVSRSSNDARPAAAARSSAERSAPDRSAERSAPAAPPAALTSGASASTSSAGNKGPAKKVPPPPVIHAPRPGARARKKLGRRMG